MKILMIENDGIKSNIGLFEFLSNYGNVDTVKFNDMSEENFDKYNSYNLCVLSGSGFVSIVGNEEMYKTEMDFVRNTNIPLIGICFGAQVIAVAFEEILSIHESKRIGLQNTIDEEGNVAMVPFNNRWYLEYLRENSQLNPEYFGEFNNHRTIDSFIVRGHRKIVGLQFHPEHKIKDNKATQIFEKYLIKFGLFVPAIPNEINKKTTINKF